MKRSQCKLDGISIIRTVATVGIMLYHIGYGHYYLTQFSLASGVHLFFCISSFLIMYTTETKTAGCFLKRRFIRIVPLYFLLTLFTFAASKFIRGFGQDHIGFAELVKSLLFIPYARSGLKSDFAVRPIVGPAWTLYYDVWFAVIFFISMKIKHKYRGLFAAIICVAASLLGMLLPKEFPIAVLLRTGFLYSFVAGIMVYYLWNLFLKQKTVSFSMFWGIGMGLLILYLYGGARSIFSKTMVSALILICFLISTYKKPVPGIVAQFSNMSFSFYLIHYYVILVVGRFIDFSKLNIQTIMGTFLVFVFTLPLSLCSYVVIEQKLSKVLNQRCSEAVAVFITQEQER